MNSIVTLMIFLALSGCSRDKRNEPAGEAQHKPTNKGRIGETEDQLTKRYGNVLERTTDGGFQRIKFQIEEYDMWFTIIEGVAEGVSVKKWGVLNPSETDVLLLKITGVPSDAWTFQSTPKFVMIDTPQGYSGFFSIKEGIVNIDSKKLDDLRTANIKERDTQGLKGF